MFLGGNTRAAAEFLLEQYEVLPMSLPGLCRFSSWLENLPSQYRKGFWPVGLKFLISRHLLEC